jgi:hypothetical protein
MKRPLLLFAVTAAGLLLTGCGLVPIGRITADPNHYLNRTVRVSGTVTTSYGILGTGGYQLEDATGKIVVISATGLPSKGAHVEVTGQVMSGIQIGGRAIGAAIRESYHKVMR